MPAYLKPCISEFLVLSGIIQTQYVIASGTIIDQSQCTGNGPFEIPPGDRAQGCFSTDPEIVTGEGDQLRLQCQETPGVTYLITIVNIQPGSITCSNPNEAPFNFQYTSSTPFPAYCTISSSIHLYGCWNGIDECTAIDYPNCVNR